MRTNRLIKRLVVQRFVYGSSTLQSSLPHKPLARGCKPTQTLMQTNTRKTQGKPKESNHVACSPLTTSRGPDSFIKWLISVSHIFIHQTACEKYAYFMCVNTIYMPVGPNPVPGDLPSRTFSLQPQQSIPLTQQLDVSLRYWLVEWAKIGFEWKPTKDLQELCWEALIYALLKHAQRKCIIHTADTSE